MAITDTDLERLALREQIEMTVSEFMSRESCRRLDFVRVLLDTARYLVEQDISTEALGGSKITGNKTEALTLQNLGHAIINEDLMGPDFIVGSLSKLWDDAAHKHKEAKKEGKS